MQHLISKPTFRGTAIDADQTNSSIVLAALNDQQHSNPKMIHSSEILLAEYS